MMILYHQYGILSDGYDYHRGSNFELLFFNPGRDIEYQIRQNLFERLLLFNLVLRESKRGYYLSYCNDVTWTRP